MKQMIALLPLAFFLTGCGPKPPKTVYPQFNNEAGINASLPWNPRTGRVITSWINPGLSMTTLYGDETAVNYARTHADGKYPVGARLGAVTWTQQEDARWFGGRIPGKVAMVELLVSNGDGASYARYESSQQTPVPTNDPERRNFLLQQRAAVMP